MLSTEPDAGAMVHASDGAIMIHQSRACGLDGVEVAVGQWEHARLVVQLVPDGQQAAATGLDVAVADLLSAPTQRSIDGEGNRVTLKRAAGDELRVTLEAESRAGIVSGDSASLARLARRGATVRRPGETVRVLVHPLLPSRSSDKVAVELRVRVKASPGGGDVHAQTILLHEADAVRPEAIGVSRPPQEFSPVTLDVPLPQREGVYDIQMEAVERGGLRWSRPIVSRTVQVVAVADVPLEEPSPAQWRVLYELDPGSPRLLERLRRIPGMGMPSVSLPTMPMPTIAMPKLLHVPMPHVQMPKIPSVGAMVPRMNGLLSIGHSSLESHPLGPVLRLPPAASADEPTWEGMVVAVTPGMPHVVEIDYPPDQDAMLGISVLEQEGAAVRETYSGGFEVLRPPVPVSQAGDASGVARAAAGSRHSFVFWPHTKMPLLLLSNASPRHSALIARVRILAGPTYLASNRHSIPAGASRRAYAYIPSPDFSAFGAVPRVESGESRPLADWNTFLIGIRHSAEWIAAQAPPAQWWACMATELRSGLQISRTEHRVGTVVDHLRARSIRCQRMCLRFYAGSTRGKSLPSCPRSPATDRWHRSRQSSRSRRLLPLESCALDAMAGRAAPSVEQQCLATTFWILGCRQPQRIWCENWRAGSAVRPPSAASQSFYLTTDGSTFRV